MQARLTENSQRLFLDKAYTRYYTSTNHRIHLVHLPRRQRGRGRRGTDVTVGFLLLGAVDHHFFPHRRVFFVRRWRGANGVVLSVGGRFDFRRGGGEVIAAAVAVDQFRGRGVGERSAIDADDTTANVVAVFRRRHLPRDHFVILVQGA